MKAADDTREGLGEYLQATADAWKILGRLGLVDTIFNHISTCVHNRLGEPFIIMNPEGMLPEEINAASLRLLPRRLYMESEASELGVNSDGLHLHSLMQSVRSKPGTVIHTHSLYSVAVSCSERGLLPMSQTALEFLGDLVLIEYGGLFRGKDLTDQMKALAINGGASLLRNHGTLVVGDSIEEAFYLAYFLEEACKIQIVTLSQGLGLVNPPESVWEDTKKALRSDRRRVAAQLFEAFRRNLLRTT